MLPAITASRFSGPAALATLFGGSLALAAFFSGLFLWLFRCRANTAGTAAPTIIAG